MISKPVFSLNVYLVILTLLPLFTTIAICSFICFYTLEAYITNNMEPDQTAPFGEGSSLIRVHNVRFHGQK